MRHNIITPEFHQNGKVIRHVRSFVCRNGRLTNGQKHALTILWPKMGLDFTSQYLSFDSIFGNNAPIILEIGFGMGNSLVTMAKNNSYHNFLGIEVYTPGIGACLTAAEKIPLSNLRLICHDAIEVLDKMVPDVSLKKVQLFFPDPWHKVKHNKRRIVQRYFAELVLQKLELGGIFHIVTDWQPYAEYIVNVMDKISYYKNLSLVGNYIPRPASRPITKFEKRGQILGNIVFDIMFERIQ